ncbi:hypothetical protein EWB00_006362 [Schistosoma japonicum]|uniref:Uncharacterized protein n=1 Tax=Schistosoma japonicum TaxID=6182 RepID=A0A4Z2CZD5_SCHJA|nr:hypothetical protein EWB00_006362 [Schistosoma japonicum]
MRTSLSATLHTTPNKIYPLSRETTPHYSSSQRVVVRCAPESPHSPPQITQITCRLGCSVSSFTLLLNVPFNCFDALSHRDINMVPNLTTNN